MDRATSLIKALDLLTLLGSSNQSYTVQDLADAMNQPRSTVVRVLNTLVEYGLIAREGRRYYCAEAFSHWATTDRYTAHRIRYRPVLEAVAKATGELVLLGTLEGAGIVHIDYIESDQAVRVAPAPVTRHNIRRNALGKLFLADRADLAERWIEEEADFADELQTVRATGVAWNHEESVQGMVAMACHGFSESPVEPKIAIAWPVHRFTEAKGREAQAAIDAACGRA